MFEGRRHGTLINSNNKMHFPTVIIFCLCCLCVCMPLRADCSRFYIVAVFSLRHRHRSCLSFLFTHKHTQASKRACSLVGPVKFQPNTIRLPFLQKRNSHIQAECVYCHCIYIFIARWWCSARRCFSFTNYHTLIAATALATAPSNRSIWMDLNEGKLGAQCDTCVVCVCTCVLYAHYLV